MYRPSWHDTWSSFAHIWTNLIHPSIVTTLRITNEQNEIKGKLDQTMSRLPHAQKVKDMSAVFCLKMEYLACGTL